jgi:hypothetical protein
MTSRQHVALVLVKAIDSGKIGKAIDSGNTIFFERHL